MFVAGRCAQREPNTKQLATVAPVAVTGPGPNALGEEAAKGAHHATAATAPATSPMTTPATTTMPTPPTTVDPHAPYVDRAHSKNVTALLGKTAYLNCRVKNLGNKTVSRGAAGLGVEVVVASRYHGDKHRTVPLFPLSKFSSHLLVFSHAAVLVAPSAELSVRECE